MLFTKSPVLIGALLIARFTSGQQSFSADPKPCPKPVPFADATYKPGQVWSYHARHGEESSTITILQVESLPKIGVVLHVRIDGFHLHNCAGGPAPQTLEHAPFTKAAIDKSVIRQLVTVEELPSFKEGYKDWLAHCGGVYTITAAEVVAADDITFNAGLGCNNS